jgi:hypothetical protein
MRIGDARHPLRRWLLPDAQQDADRWVVKAIAKNDRVGYYGESRRRKVGVMEHRGDAYRYETENKALGAAYHAKELGIFVEFELEELPLKPRFKTPDVDQEGSGGRH